MVVSDKWHRQGLGTEFMKQTIYVAKHKKLKKIHGVVLKDNLPMMNLVKEFNFKITEGDPGEYKVEYDV